MPLAVAAERTEVVLPVGVAFDPETMRAGLDWMDVVSGTATFARNLVAEVEPGEYEDGTVVGVVSVGALKDRKLYRPALVFRYKYAG